MEPVSIGLMLFLLCGQTVGVVASIPKSDGTREIISGPVDGAQRAWWIAEALRIEKLKDGLVIRIAVEKQVEGVRCPVAT